MTDVTDTGAAAPQRYFISEADLRALAADLLGAGTDVIAPVSVDACQSPSALATAACMRPGVAPVDVEYKAIGDAAELDLGRDLPVLSLKQFFLPDHEALCRWHQRGLEVTVE